MNDKTRDLQQDSEELLVTSTSSSIITESIVSLSEAETTESDTSTTGVCHRVTSSTGNNSNCTPDEDDYVESTQLAIVDANVSVDKDNSSSTMGGTSNNDAETCVLPTSSNYIEQSNDNTKNMVITRSGSNSTEFNNIRTDLLITPTTSAAAIAAAAVVQNLTAPTTRSKRKLMTEGSGSVSLGRNSINLNHKSIKLDIKNHQSSMTTRKSSSVSINSLLNQDDKIKFDDKSGSSSSSGKPSANVLSKYQMISKTNAINEDAGCSSNACSNKLINKKYNCINDLDSNDKVDESHLNKNDTTMCTISTADDNDDSDSSRTKSPVMNSCDNDDKVQIIGENRKVEPLKINLNRDTVKTKIIIKPIVRPANLMDSDRPGSPMIPKLTIKSPSNLNVISTIGDSKGTPNGSDQPPHEPHIVPKLTIRASESNSSLSNADIKHTVVPKLTIKIDGAINCINSSPSSASPSPPPLPKLTIKTSGDISGSIISKHSPKSSSSSQCHVVSTSCSILSNSPTQTTIIPKLTIKPIPKPSTSNGSETAIQTFPKLTIKPIPPPPPVLSESSCNESDCTDDAEPIEKASVPKLTIRTGIEHSVKIQHSELSNTIPKLTIRTISEQSGEPGEKSLIVPKFTIKSSVQENTQSIPKLTIAVNDVASSSSINSPGSEKIPKLTIRQVEQDEVDRIPKLMISSVHSNDDVEKVPKLLIKQVQDIDSMDKLPKLTIRTCTESTDDLDKIPKLTIKSILESSGECSEKVPKLMIRQIPDTDDGNGEKVSKLKISSVQESDCGLHSVPKLMIKQVQEDDEKVPKLTIISKSVCEDSAKIRKLKIKPVQDFSKMCGHNVQESSENVGRISKLEVRTTEPFDGEKIPKLMIRQVQDNDGEGKIPKITIIQSVANCQNETDKETGVFRKIKSPVRNKEDSCEDENPASKMLKLSPKNDLVNLADLSSFRKEEREREKEKEKEKKNEIEKKTTEENDIEHDELLDRPKSGRFQQDVVEIDDEPEEDRTTSTLKMILKKDCVLERDGRLKNEFIGIRLNAEGKLTDKTGSTSENKSEKQAQMVQNYALTSDALRGSLGLRSKVPEHEEATIGKYFSNDPQIETIDLESESEACSGSQGSNNEEKQTNRESIDAALAPEMQDVIDIDNDVEVIYLDQDQDSSESISNTKTSKCTGGMSSPKLCDIPMEPPSDLLDPNSFPIESVDLTTPSPGNSPVHLVNEEINLNRHTILRRVLEESIVKDKSKDLSRIPSTSLENMLANRRDDIKHEKLFRVNCTPNSNESTQSPKNFSEQIMLENSQNLTMPVHERLLLNSTCFRSSPFQEDQSKSTDNSSEPAHLDEKFLSNVDVLSCLGICKENVNNSTFNAVTVDDVLRRNNNKEALTVALVPPPEEIIIDDSSQESKLKRSTDSEDPLGSEAPPVKKARSGKKDSTTQNAIPDNVSSDSGVSKFESSKSSKSLSPKDSSNLTETSCDEKFRTMLGLKDFDDEHDMKSVSKDGKSSSGLRGVFGTIQKDKDELSKSSQNDASLNLGKSLESKIVLIQEAEESSENTKIRENLLLINEESVSDGIMADECTSDPLSNFTTPTDEKRVQEVDSGVDISSSVKSESVPETPVKRPRGRPRKDGRPAGSVKKPEKKVRESTVVIKTSGRRRSKNVSVEVEKPREVTLGRPRKRQSLKASQAVTPEQIVEISSSPPVLDVKPIDTTTTDESPVVATPLDTTPLPITPAEPYPQDITPLDTTPLTIFNSESPEKTENVTPSTPLRPLRGRGSRGGRISRSAGRGSRGARTGKSRNFTPRSRSRGEAIPIPATPEKEVIFFSPERKKTVEEKTPKSVKKRKTPKASPSLQVFEEDTRMSAESISTQPRPPEILNHEDTQSSIQSSASVLEGSGATVKKRAKMEVTLPEGKTEYTVDMIAEYDWPPPKGCCPAKNRDTFMIQEQIAQYLGIKSFKRKYPDLPRRQIDMEERNYLREKGLVTEKMCDLGITAVWASDVLDIMYSDFYDKYEEYKNYLRQKQLRDIEAKQKALAAEAVDKGILARERALQSAAKWNSNFNKARKEDRRLCLDLQSLVIQIPSTVGKKMSRPSLTQQPPPSSDYPVALVPGQFAECYRTYTPQELRCYPINTIIEDTVPVSDRLRPKVECDDCSSSESESDDSNSSCSDSECSSIDSDSDSHLLSDDDEPPDDDKKKCFVCHQAQNRNLHGMPEVFIRCVTCRRRTHPSCISMPRRMVTRVRNYNWQCADCKCCIKCKRKQEENKMLFCEQCDRGYHIYCLQIKNIPEGRWHCERCAICMRCGARKPEGDLPPPTPPLSNQEDRKKSSKKKAKWVHEYKIDHLTKIREHFSILCVPCARSKASKPKS